MSDDIEFTVRVPLTPEQAEILKDPAALAFVEREMAEALAREWPKEMERYFLFGPRS